MIYTQQPGLSTRPLRELEALWDPMLHDLNLLTDTCGAIPTPPWATVRTKWGEKIGESPEHRINLKQESKRKHLNKHICLNKKRRVELWASRKAEALFLSCSGSESAVFSPTQHLSPSQPPGDMSRTRQIQIAPWSPASLHCTALMNFSSLSSYHLLCQFLKLSS